MTRTEELFAQLVEAAKSSPLEWKQMNVPDGCYINSGKDGWQFLIYVENEHFGVVFDTPKKRTVYNAEQFTAAEAIDYVHELARVEVKDA